MKCKVRVLLFCVLYSLFIYFFSKTVKEKKNGPQEERETNCWNDTAQILWFFSSHVCAKSPRQDLGAKKLNAYQIFPFHVWNMQNHFPCFMVIQFYRVSKYFFPPDFKIKRTFQFRNKYPASTKGFALGNLSN